MNALAVMTGWATEFYCHQNTSRLLYTCSFWVKLHLTNIIVSTHATLTSQKGYQIETSLHRASKVTLYSTTILCDLILHILAFLEGWTLCTTWQSHAVNHGSDGCWIHWKLNSNGVWYTSYTLQIIDRS